MAEPWENDPIIVPAKKPAPEPWENDPIIVHASRRGADPEFVDAPAPEFVDGPPPRSQANFGLGLRASMQAGVFGPVGQLLTRGTPSADTTQRQAQGVGEAFQAGLQGSSGGLLYRGQLPSVVLDAHHASTFEHLAQLAGNVIGDFPAMVTGFAAGTAAGIESGPGALAVGGAAGMAIPTAIRQALVQAYSLDQVQSAGDFLNQTAISIKETGKSGVLGAIMGPAAKAGSLLPAGTSALARAGVGLTAEYGTMAVAPALLDFRLPEKHDFLDAAVMMGGFKAAHAVSGKLMEVYRRTGKTPIEVMADAADDPSIKADLLKVNAGVQIESSADAGGKTTHKFSIRDTQGAAVGEGMVDVTPTTVRLWDIGVDEGSRGKGFGLAAYEHWIGEAARSGKTFASDSNVSSDAQHIYDILQKKGFEVSKNPVAIEDSNGRLTTPDGSPVFTIESGATPEQWAKFDADLKAADTELPEAYKVQAAMQAAEDALPGGDFLKTRPEAILANPYAEIQEAKLPYSLNMKYIEGPEDLRALQVRIGEVYREHIDWARGGTQSWAETEAKAARQVAEMTGQDLQKVMEGRRPGDTYNAVQLKIQGDMLMQATVEAAEAIKRVKDAGNEVSDAMRMEALEAIHRSAMIQAEFTGASAEAGRALQYLRKVKEVRAQGEGIQKLVEAYGADPDVLLKMAADMDSPEALAKFARGATKATTEQMVLEAWKAGLVSGPFTQVANVMGNTTYMALRPLVDAAAAVGGFVTRAPDRVAMAEPLARVFGDLHGIMDGLKLAKSTFLHDATGGKAESRQAIPGTAGHIIRTPFRALGAMDQIFRTMTERGEAYALSTRQAVREGFNPATREFRERVAELAANPTEAMQAEITAFGERGTFNTPLGEKGRAISNAIVKAHLEFAVPFRGTPANIFKEMARLTPFAWSIGEWKADYIAGGTRAQKAIAEIAVGTGLSAVTMTLAMSGNISGNGDPDPNKRRIQLASGWQPYSVKIGNTWYSYQRFQPVGTLVGLAADMAEAWEHMTPEESDKVPKILGTAFANAVTNQTFLQGIAQLIAAVAHPERDMARFLNTLGSSVIPAALGQTAQMLDPFQREIDGIKEGIMNRIPGLRNTLQPMRDPFGEPVPSADRIGWVSPITVKEQSVDKVRTEAARLGIGTGKTPKSVNLPAAGIPDLGKVDLTPQQRDIFGDVAGHFAHQILSEIVGAAGWDEIPDVSKVQIYERVFEQASHVGAAAALPPEQRQAEAERISAEIMKRFQK